MQRYILGRIGQALITLFVISIIVFVLARMTGDPVLLMMPQDATRADYEATRHRLGFDKPVYVQYGVFILKAAQGDFGQSVRTNRPAMVMVMERFPATIQLSLLALAFSVLLAVPIGVLSAVRRDSILDRFSFLFAILGQSAPQFWIGIMLVYLFAVLLGLLPPFGRGGIPNMLLPGFTLGWYLMAGLVRLSRSSMLDVLDSEYVKMARTKGVPERAVIWKHGFRNACIPVVTFAGMTLAGLLNGSVIVESVFAWPGVGRLAVEAVMWRDFPTVQAVVIVVAAVYIALNLVVDILYAVIDPRIKYG